MFDQSKFSPISAQANSDSPRFWSYDAGADTSADVIGDQYFAKKVFQIQEGDVVFVKATDGEVLGRFASTSNGHKIIALTGAGSSAGEQTVIAKLEDFDNFDDDFVYVSQSKSYHIVAFVNIGARVLNLAGNASFSGIGFRLCGLISTASVGALINSTASFFASDVSFQADNIDMFNSIGLGLFNVLDTRFIGGRGGAITMDAGSSLVFRFAQLDSTISPVVIDGDYNRIDFDEFFADGLTIAAGETFAQLAATATIAERVSVSKSYATIDTGGVYLDILDTSALPNEGLQVSNCTFAGVGGETAVTGVTSKDNQAFFSNNVGLLSSVPNSGWTINDNALSTTINTTGVYESIVTDNSTVLSTSSRFDLAFPLLTSTGAKPRAFLVTSSLVLETATTNQRVSARVFINDIASEVGFLATTTGSAANRIENLSINGTIAIFPTDTVEMKVTNESTTDAVNVLDAYFQIVSVSY